LAWLYSGWVKVALGDTDAALERIAQARRLSPADPHRFSFDAAASMAQLFAGRLDEALALAQSCIRDRPRFLLYNLLAIVPAALSGRHELAKSLLERTLQFHPLLHLAEVATIVPIRRPEHADLWRRGLHLAGISGP
jgi:tetratricopeptide (TPR) repeat protein